MTDETQIRQCVRCGTPLAEGTYWCPACGKLNASTATRVIFVLIIVGTLAGIAFTRWYVGYLRSMESALSQRWFMRGQDALAKKYPELAVEYYRNALGYDAGNPQYRLRLAEALQADGHLKEARAYLLGLWSEEPANGEVNLDLARLFAQRRDTKDTVRYYRSAIDGVWTTNALQQRLAARLEFVDYLLGQGNRSGAIAELIALQSDAPPEDAALNLRIGQLLLQLGEYARAQSTFEAIAKENPNSREAWSGAGRAALALGDYRKSEKLLLTAVKLNPRDESDAKELELARQVMALDPNGRMLSLTERAKRTADAFEFAMSRLTNCAGQQGTVLLPSSAMPARKADSAPAKDKDVPSPEVATAPGPLQLLYDSGVQRRASASAAGLRDNPDAIVPTMEFVYQVVRATEYGCPEDSKARAMQLLAARDAQERR